MNNNENFNEKLLQIYKDLLSSPKYKRYGCIIIPNNDKLDVYKIDVDHLMEYITIEKMRLLNNKE